MINGVSGFTGMSLVSDEDYQFKQAYSVLKSWQFISEWRQ